MLELLPAAAEYADPRRPTRLGKSNEAVAETLQVKTDPTQAGRHGDGFVRQIAESVTDAAANNLVSKRSAIFEQALAGGTGDLAVQLALARLWCRPASRSGHSTLRAFLDERPDYAEAVLLLADARRRPSVERRRRCVEALVADQPADTSARPAGRALRRDGLDGRGGRVGELSRRNRRSRIPDAARHGARDAGDINAGRALMAILATRRATCPLVSARKSAARRARRGCRDAARHIAEIDPADRAGRWLSPRRKS